MENDKERRTIRPKSPAEMKIIIDRIIKRMKGKCDVQMQTFQNRRISPGKDI